MRKFLWKYVSGGETTRWAKSSLETAQDHERGPHHARLLREWTRAFLADHKDLPINLYGTWKTSMLDDEGLQQGIYLHLQTLGPYVRAQDLVDFMKKPETMAKFNLKKPISLATAQRWMKRLGYRWTVTPTGQYVDGHERADVVNYRQKKFLPRWMSIEERTRRWKAGFKEAEDVEEMRPIHRRIVVWFHDESTFYANDRRRQRWVHKDENAVPRAKGEGASLMVADFVSADYGWLASPDKTERARILFKAGKNREGYFTNDDTLKHATTAMDILTKYYPNEEHILVFDNATTTHTKRSDSSLSARHMPKGTKAVGEFWGATVPVLDSDGKQVYLRDETGKLTRKPATQKIRMDDATFPDGTPQSLYFPDDHAPLISAVLWDEAWAQSVERDSTFIVFNCGNFERIGFRHRASQTLYLTDLIDVVNCESPAYGLIQTGLYMSIVQDAIERMKQHQAKEELALPKNLKRQRSTVSLPSKRHKTRAATAKEINEVQTERENLEVSSNSQSPNTQGLISVTQLVKKYAATRSLALIELRYGVYNSPAPASFVRSKTRRNTRYKSNEYLSLVLTSEIASGATGVAHVAELKVLVAGRTLSSAAVVKLAFEPEQIQRLRHEFSIFQHLKSQGVVEGIPFIFGLFEDVETDALALVMTHVGTCLLTLWPNLRDMKLKLPEAARTSFHRVMSSIHQAGVRHMDIRPENLTIAGDDQAAIIDFDQAELNHSEGAKRREMRHLTALLNGSYRPPGAFPSGQTTPEQNTPEPETTARRKASLQPVAESDETEDPDDAVDNHDASGKNNP
ncbi:hypothetical protein D9615_010264 [Tricholomella constricta]|uniref:Protein kinase domain-containing protein n=1 Tax=Tricholomella constricta TaxID=117010 RepID=A0A8H5LU42_9AGAR|nr:hypothetical protein D9615_010264 [Tricholomella constricta]